MNFLRRSSPGPPRRVRERDMRDDPKVSRVLYEVVLIGTLSIVIGLAVLVWTMYSFDLDAATGKWQRPTGKVLENLGVAAIVFGVFNIIVGLPDWSRYFERRLQNIVLDHGYLRSLKKDQLRTLSRRVTRAMFDDEDVDREGSFADYFDRHLHEDLGNPYREKVRGVMTYEDDGEFFFVHDFVSYVVRANRGQTQQFVTWENDEDEIERVMSVRVGIRFPDGHKRAGQSEILENKVGSDANPLPRRVVVNSSLEEYASVDALIVEVESTYLVKKSRFQYWEMSTSTRDFSLTINHPSTYSVVFKAFVHYPDVTKSERMPGRYHFECDSWMFAHSGVAWRLEGRDSQVPLREFLDANPLIGTVPVTTA